jgi:adenosylmethionine-8-amino-7-oxononanoate aminotransferase
MFESIKHTLSFAQSILGSRTGENSGNETNFASSYFGRNLLELPEEIVKGKGCYLYTKDNRKILDGSSGAAVSSIGHKDKRVINAMVKKLKTGVTYLASAFWLDANVVELCDVLARSTEIPGTSVYLAGGGSDVGEAGIKVARQYFWEMDKESPRVNFITREGSYHGNTLGTLSVSGFPARTEIFEPLFGKNVSRVSSCHSYRQRLEGETDNDFVKRKATELDKKFQEVGPETVIGFIAEPIVGAALGCVCYVPGYFEAMKEVCEKYGALFILDEIMCGMGRTGTMHAWQDTKVVPDIQMVGKGLAGGYQPLSALFIAPKLAEVFKKGSGLMVHGFTFQAMPIQAAAGLAVQKVIQKDNLLENVREQGQYLGDRLKSLLSDHPNVGDIRGKGLFWGIEFVEDKVTKTGFSPDKKVSYSLAKMARGSPYNLSIYPCAGNNDGGIYGDQIIIAPPFIITRKQVDELVMKLHAAILKKFPLN